MDQNEEREGALNMENNIITKVVNVTPDMAREWLASNTKNRKGRPCVVDKYARDMVEWKWMLTHQGIAFDADGTLIDGQHRLLAICKANVPVQMMVTRGFEPHTMSMVDVGAGRRLSDIIRWETDDAWINSKQTQALARFIYSEMMRINHSPSIRELIDFMRKYEPAMRYGYGFRNSHHKCGNAVMLTLAVATGVCNIPIRATQAFFDIVNSNILPSDGTEYNVKAALDAKDYLAKCSTLHRQHEAVVQKYYWLFYENKKRVPSDWGDKIIYPITNAGLDAFCGKVGGLVFDNALKVEHAILIRHGISDMEIWQLGIWILAAGGSWIRARRPGGD
jgi:hypothetical protein